MSNESYTNEQQEAFCALAMEVGVNRARRELGYPKTSTSGIKWLNQRGMKPDVNKVMQQAKLWHTYYEAEDLIEQVDTALHIVSELIMNCETADDAKKLAEAIQKLNNTRLLLEGKATTINEKREVTPIDLEVMRLVEEQKNMNKELVDAL